MTSRMFHRICFGALVLAAAPLCAQTGNSVPVPAVTGPVDTEDRMLTPPTVSGQDYPVVYASEARANYLRGGITFTSAYSDNVLAGTGGTPVSDISYSVWPTLAIDETTPRLHWMLSYAPGFTFYRRTDARNEADHNLSAGFEYRLSQHVTVSLRDSFQKSSNAFNQPDQGLAVGVSGSTQGSSNFIVAPIADRLTNTGSAGITYQFGANTMVGASGTFTNLHYPDLTKVPGLYDTSSRAGSAFYGWRLSKRHYVGATYQYQKLLAYPTGATTDTQTHAVLFFYTMYPTSRFTVSVFGGPQRSETAQLTQPATHSVTPAAGGSLGWQAQRTALALGYSHLVSGGGGLIGAARSDTANVVVRQQITKNLGASLAGSYSNYQVLVVPPFPDTSGHSISGSASVQRQFGRSLGLQIGYTRLHQIYTNVPVVSSNPDTNREWVSISYEFTKALGR
jgi:hypothetical protein